MKILFDPGHGGDKPGAVYDPDVHTPGDEIEEKDINLYVALHCGRILRDKGHAVLFTRDKDVHVPLARRKELINEYRTDCFVSIHVNAGGGKGVEAFFRDDRDYPLARICQQYLAAYTGLGDRGVFQDVARLGKRLTVLDDSAEIPATLLELGFIDNDADRTYLTRNIVTVAEILADAIHEYAVRKLSPSPSGRGQG